MMKINFKPTLLITLVVALLFVLPHAMAEEPGKININTASLDELVMLDRIGPKYAQRIIEYRETAGPFTAAEDIMKVKGIGMKTFEANKDKISVD